MAIFLAYISGSNISLDTGNLLVNDIVQDTQKVLIVDPTVYSPSSGQITSNASLESAKSFITTSYSTTASNFLNSAWTTGGWNLSNLQDDLGDFVTNNVTPFDGGGNFGNTLIVIGQKNISGNDYTFVFCYPGNISNIPPSLSLQYFIWGPIEEIPLGYNQSSPIQLSFWPTLQYIENNSNTIGLDLLGRVWSSGQNSSGGLGDGTIISRSSPVLMLGNHSFVQVTHTGSNTAGLKENGEVWSVGSNVGIGDNTNASKSSPVLVAGNHSFMSITSSASALFGLKENGEVWTWGSNTNGQLGINAAGSRSSPSLVVGNHSFVKIAGKSSGCSGLKQNGEVWNWGRGALGRNGDGNNLDRSSPVQVIGAHSFIDVFGNFAKKSEGSNWGWGLNSSAQLGDGTTANRSSPVQVIGAHSFIKISSRSGMGAGLKENGEVWSWGTNSSGRLGSEVAGTSVSGRSSPVIVLGNISFSDIASGNLNIVGISLNTPWGWGSTAFGKLGISRNPTSSPVLANFGLSNISKIIRLIPPEFVTSGHQEQGTLILNDTGNVWGLGSNSSGQLGTGNLEAAYSSPVQILGNHIFIDVIRASETCYGLKENGEIWSWGKNLDGELGDNSIDNKSSPVLVVGDHSFYSLALRSNFESNNHMGALKLDGSCWTWGNNVNGQLGDETDQNSSSPVLVVGDHSFIDLVIANNGSAALKLDGSCWTWGSNTYGLLGDETDLNSSSPVLVVGDHSFIDLVCSSEVICGLKENGEIWSWGGGDKGQLGNLDTQISSSPVLVVGDHSFIQVTSGSKSFYAKKQNGEIWSWGSNDSGELGDGSFSDRSSPVLVIGSYTWESLFKFGPGASSII